MEFEQVGAFEALNQMDETTIDAIPFGVIGLKPDATVKIYNKYEQEVAGLGLDASIGLNFFLEVAPCMNNFMVAQRMLDEPELDEVVPYILTIRLRPTPVTLRLLKKPDAETMYILLKLGA